MSEHEHDFDWEQDDHPNLRALMEEHMPALTKTAVVMFGTCECGETRARWGYGPDKGTTIPCQVFRR